MGESRGLREGLPQHQGLQLVLDSAQRLLPYQPHVLCVLPKRVDTSRPPQRLATARKSGGQPAQPGGDSAAGEVPLHHTEGGHK